MASTTQRGYGSAHQAERRRWVPLVNAGLVNCWRCGKLIIPGTPWDLGHDDFDRSIYRGPEHPGENRRAGGIKGNRSPLRKRANTWRPRPAFYPPPKRTDLTW